MSAPIIAPVAAAATDAVAAVQPQVAFAPVAAADAAAAPPLVAFAFPTTVLTDRGGCPYNQDRAFVDAAHRQIGVFDGHGDHGEAAAQTAADTFAATHETPFSELFATAETNIRTAISTAVANAGISTIEEGGALYRRGIYGARGTQIRGGTTASVVRFDPDGAMTVANVGDSDVVIFDSDTDPGRSLIADHSCTNLDEWIRVHAAHPTTRFRFNNPNIYAAERPVWIPQAVLNPELPEPWALNPAGGYHYSDVRNSWATYVTVADGSESLAMTRALGDFHLKRHGVIAAPAIQTAPAPAPNTTRAVIIGSDGLWDTLQFEEARGIVYRADLVNRPDAATAALMAYGKERARTLMGAGHDNIACAVIYVMVAPPPPEAPPAFTGPLPLPPTLIDPDADSIAPLPAAEAPAVLDCALHGPMVRNPGGLWYTMNEAGYYSMTAPPCNGCARGDDDARIASLSAAYRDALYAYRDNPTQENKDAMDAAYRARYGAEGM